MMKKSRERETRHLLGELKLLRSNMTKSLPKDKKAANKLRMRCHVAVQYITQVVDTAIPWQLQCLISQGAIKMFWGRAVSVGAKAMAVTMQPSDARDLLIELSSALSKMTTPGSAIDITMLPSLLELDAELAEQFGASILKWDRDTRNFRKILLRLATSYLDLETIAVMATASNAAVPDDDAIKRETTLFDHQRHVSPPDTSPEITRKILRMAMAAARVLAQERHVSQAGNNVFNRSERAAAKSLEGKFSLKELRAIVADKEMVESFAADASTASLIVQEVEGVIVSRVRHRKKFLKRKSSLSLLSEDMDSPSDETGTPRKSVNIKTRQLAIEPLDCSLQCLVAVKDGKEVFEHLQILKKTLNEGGANLKVALLDYEYSQGKNGRSPSRKVQSKSKTTETVNLPLLTVEDNDNILILPTLYECAVKANAAGQEDTLLLVCEILHGFVAALDKRRFEGGAKTKSLALPPLEDVIEDLRLDTVAMRSQRQIEGDDLNIEGEIDESTAEMLRQIEKQKQELMRKLAEGNASVEEFENVAIADEVTTSEGEMAMTGGETAKTEGETVTAEGEKVTGEAETAKTEGETAIVEGETADTIAEQDDAVLSPRAEGSSPQEGEGVEFDSQRMRVFLLASAQFHLRKKKDATGTIDPDRENNLYGLLKVVAEIAAQPDGRLAAADEHGNLELSKEERTRAKAILNGRATSRLLFRMSKDSAIPKFAQEACHSLGKYKEQHKQLHQRMTLRKIDAPCPRGRKDSLDKLQSKATAARKKAGAQAKSRKKKQKQQLQKKKDTHDRCMREWEEGTTPRMKNIVRKLFRGNKVSDFRRAFRQFDLNGNGIIDAQEFSLVVRGMGSLNPDESEFVWNVLDCDMTGMIDFQMFMRLLQSLSKKRKELKRSQSKAHLELDAIQVLIEREMDCYEAFAKFDLNGNGDISYEEYIPIANYLGVDAQYAEIAFRRFDLDNTHTLSRDEFVSLYNTIQREIRGLDQPPSSKKKSKKKFKSAMSIDKRKLSEMRPNTSPNLGYGSSRSFRSKRGVREKNLTRRRSRRRGRDFAPHEHDEPSITFEFGDSKWSDGKLPQL